MQQMQMAQTTPTPTTGASKLRPRSGRTPLQPKNSPATTTPVADPLPKSKSKQERAEISLVVMADSANKENLHSTMPMPMDASLADELIAIKKRLERLKADKERTERMLSERELELDRQMKEMEQRGEFQKCLEMEVDKLFRLKELKSRCMKVSPIKSLREKELVKTVHESPSEVMKTEEMMESEEESGLLQSPGSASSETDNTQRI